MLQVLPTPALDPTRIGAHDDARRPARARKRSRLRLAALVATTAALAGGGAGAADALAASTPAATVAYTEVDSMVQSTGNLYWTSHYRDEIYGQTATLYRASKWSTPGQERALYSEKEGAHFGDLTYAYASGDYHAYFVVNYPELGVSKIKRVPLGGGPAVTLATSPAYIAMRDIDTDGSSLYWADAGGLRKMSIYGGPITTLLGSTNITVFGLDATRVIYGTGVDLRSVLKTGGPSRLHHSARGKITAIDVIEGSDGKVYWGSEDGTVQSGQLKNNGMLYDPAYQTLGAWRPVTSVAFDGKRVLWADCQLNGTDCIVRTWSSAGRTHPSVGSIGIGVKNVIGDATMMFWSDPLPKRYVHSS